MGWIHGVKTWYLPNLAASFFWARLAIVGSIGINFCSWGCFWGFFFPFPAFALGPPWSRWKGPPGPSKGPPWAHQRYPRANPEVPPSQGPSALVLECPFSLPGPFPPQDPPPPIALHEFLSSQP